MSRTERPFSHPQRKLISRRRHWGHPCVPCTFVWCLEAFCFCYQKRGHLHGSPPSHSPKEDLFFLHTIPRILFLGVRGGRGVCSGERSHHCMDRSGTWHPGEGRVLLAPCLDRGILVFRRLSSGHHAPPNVSTLVPLTAHFHPDGKIFFFYSF